jgi:hypothetical protein
MDLGGDAFVAKLSVDGSRLIFSTYWGGSGIDTALGIAVDVANNDTYIVGNTFSNDFPLTNALTGVPESTSQQCKAFVARFSETGNVLYSTYISADSYGRDSAGDADVDSITGDLLVIGSTTSENFPVTEDAIQGRHGNEESAIVAHDAFICRINPENSSSSEDSSDNNTNNIINPSCAITSISAGSSLMKELPIFRKFRDEYLKQFKMGKSIIRTYYAYSPIIANYVNNRPAIKLISRITIAGAIIHLKKHFACSEMKK